MAPAIGVYMNANTATKTSKPATLPSKPVAPVNTHHEFGFSTKSYPSPF
jgi:hypothetical protein